MVGFNSRVDTAEERLNKLDNLRKSLIMKRREIIIICIKSYGK